MTMKNILAIGAAAAAMALAAGSAAMATDAGADGTATASATVLVPLSIDTIVNLGFGNVIAPTTGSVYAVIPATTGVIDHAGGLQSPASNHSTQQAGSFKVHGTGSVDYSITINTTGADITMSGSDTKVKVGEFTLAKGTTSVSVNSGIASTTLDSTGVEIVSIGGKLTVAAGAAGMYTADIPIHVNYN